MAAFLPVSRIFCQAKGDLKIRPLKIPLTTYLLVRVGIPTGPSIKENDGEMSPDNKQDALDSYDINVPRTERTLVPRVKC